MSNGSSVTGVRVLPLRGTGPLLPIVEGGGSARAVIWPGTGATMRSVHLIQLTPSSGTVRLEHRAESVYYVLNGSGTVVGDGPSGATPLAPGSMVHVGPGAGYRFVASTGGLEIFGGPCPCDPAVYGEPGQPDGGAPGSRAGQTGRASSLPVQVLHQDEPAL